MISRRRLIGGGALLLVSADRSAWAEDAVQTLGLFQPKRLIVAPDFTVPGLACSPALPRGRATGTALHLTR